jgi:putative inorganic carbon (HCO3(-)) transporter
MRSGPSMDFARLPVRFGALVLAAAGILGIVSLFATEYSWLAIVPPILLLAMFVLGRLPRMGYLLIIFLLPFENIINLAGSRMLTLPKFIGLWLLIVTAVALVVDRKFVPNLRSNLWVPVVLFLLLNLVSAFASAYPLVAFDEIRKLVTAGLFFGLTLVYISRRELESTLPGIVIGSILINLVLFSVDYILQIPLGGGGQPLFPRAPDPAAALTSSYSGMIIFSLPLLWHSFLKRRTVAGRALHLAMGAALLSGAVYTRSRAAAVLFLVTLLALFVEYAWRIKPRNLGFIISIASLGLVAMLVLTPEAYWSHQRSAANAATDASVSRRLTYLTVAWQSFRESPVMGTGPGTFKELYAVSPYPPLFSDFSSDYRRVAHNTYVEVLVGSGLPSMLLFVAMIWLAMRNYGVARRMFREKGRLEMMSLVGAYRISLLILALLFFFVSHLYMKYFWMALALSTVALRLAREEGAAGDVSPGSPPPRSSARR